MPIDRHNNANPPRPLMPTLASSRTAKTPVAPRLAATIPSTTTSTRRSDRNEGGSTPNTTLYSPFTTPASKNVLNSNVTPRSSTRKSRAGSNQSTPNDTPVNSPMNGSRPVSGIDFYKRDAGNIQTGLGIMNQGPTIGGRSRSILVPGNAQGSSVRSRSPHSTLSGVAGSDLGSREEPSMFFHASDAKPQPRAPLPVQKKTPGFFYADGQRESTAADSTDIPSPPLSSLGKGSTDGGQFFHANATSEIRPNVATPTPPILTTSPEPVASALHPRAAAFRSPSPEKINIHLSYRRGASQIMRPNGHRPAPVSILSNPGHGGRRSSTEAPNVRASHTKSSSLSSIDSISTPPRYNDTKLEVTSPTSPIRADITVPAVRETSGRQSNSSAESNAPRLGGIQETPSELSISGPQSPTVPLQAGANLQKMKELAANARRERKVLDLEISNSSLLAINRQLEREVRKQKAELRRFRRLSRAGRLSTTSELTDIGTTATLSDIEDSDAEHSNSSPSSFSEDDDDDEDESNLSPSALAARDARYIRKDTKRLHLDLSKHKDLLIDSQKMNQSLKRCLGWTEELIAEGKKALVYQVRVSDVKLGGRVLTEEDQADHDSEHGEEDDDEGTVGRGSGLLSPWTPNLEKQEGEIEMLLASITAARADRDSGIELGMSGVT